MPVNQEKPPKNLNLFVVEVSTHLTSASLKTRSVFTARIRDTCQKKIRNQEVNQLSDTTSEQEQEEELQL